jgi:hypothetical protein
VWCSLGSVGDEKAQCEEDSECSGAFHDFGSRWGKSKAGGGWRAGLLLAKWGMSCELLSLCRRLVVTTECFRR